MVTRGKWEGTVGEFGIDKDTIARDLCCNEHCRDLRGQRPLGPTWAGFYNLMNLMTQMGSLAGKGHVVPTLKQSEPGIAKSSQEAPRQPHREYTKLLGTVPHL